jgi:trehalose synthase
LLEHVGISDKKIESYLNIVPNDLLTEIRAQASILSGARICHISSTPFGGGITELLYAVVPLERDLGLHVDWLALRASEKFFSLGKKIHNALQGGTVDISEQDKIAYLQFNRDIARSLDVKNYDVIIVHTTNLLALPHSTKPGETRWIWRCHQDTSAPEPSMWDFLEPYLNQFQGAIFTLPGFESTSFKSRFLGHICPAIDPLSPKNRELPVAECASLVAEYGIDAKRPILLHVSRLDQWKDPLGLIDCYYIAKESIPELQLIIISSLSLDDPDTFLTLRTVDAEAAKDVDIHVYTNMDGFGDVEVNALQRVCTLGIQKSIREGFGMAVAETLWKGKPVIGSRVGGITAQLTGKLDFCLANDITECAEKIIRLLTDTKFALELGSFGQENVRQHFLSPRLLRDELVFLTNLLNRQRNSS